ncbi:uncharacterized protein PG998_014356 [Apiospora kogelbergensis]|uniref:uncharacterized protein n=1 Tax=Apiospora kogelbergensis TaxID=1337665 RepID=UPI003132942B
MNDILKQFLLTNSGYFRKLTDLRAKGWQTTEGDRFFEKRRNQSDNADERQARAFFAMTCMIGDELDEVTSVLMLAGTGTNAPWALDMGMAPGGFTSAFLRRHPTGTVRGISLPPEAGGLRIMIPRWQSDRRIQLIFLDVTLLADEMGVPAATISPAHADSANFSSQRPFLDEQFHIIFCGAAVQRTHSRAAYRDSCERLRLTTSQLVVALQRICDGGSLVVLLHKPEAWENIELIRTFTQFSNVYLFKPQRKHAIRSSFYMVATKVRPRHADALLALSTWKASWQAATFRNDDAREPSFHVPEDRIHSLLETFGPQFIALATPIWKTQAAALQGASFLKTAREPAEQNVIDGKGKSTQQ